MARSRQIDSEVVPSVSEGPGGKGGAKLFWISACLSLGLACWLPSTVTAQEGRFGESASVVVVEVPVYVTKDGQPLRGLTADNFEVLDGKTRRPLTGFEVIDLASAAAPAAATAAGRPSMPLAGRRHFLLLFDLSFAEPDSIVKARHAAQELVRTSLHPSDLVAVATYSVTKGAELVLGFTPDRRQVEVAIESLGLPQLLGRHPDPLNVVIADMEALEAKGQLNWKDAIVLEQLRDARRVTNWEQRALENQVVALTRSFTDLAQMMAAVDGRKFVVYLSEGFEASLTGGKGVDQETWEAVVEGETWKAESEKIYGSTRVQNDLANMLEAMRRADCVIQAVDIGGARAAGASAAQARGDEPGVGLGGRDSLLTMAQGTGGELFEGFNDLSAAMSKLLTRTSVTYLLAFQPDDLRADGSFHNLTVRLKGAPRGARVHHRAGYYAPDPRRAVDPREQRLRAAASLLGDEDGGDLPISVLPLPGGAGTVPLLVEVDGPALLARRPARQLEVEIYAYAFDRQQAVRGWLTQQVTLDLDKVEPRLRGSGLRFYGDLELPPGAYSLRVLVRDTSTGRQALRTVPLEVPAPAAAGLHLSPPLFLQSADAWLLAREAQPAGAAPRQDLFTFDGRPFVPAARPVLAAGREAPLTVLAYNLGRAEVAAAAGVLRADGRPAAGGTFRLLERQPGGVAGAPDRLLAVFTPAGLAPGEYLLRVTVTDRASGAAGASSIPFVVVAAPGASGGPAR